MANLSKTTRDHEEIRRWAEERGGHPACVKGTGNEGDIGILRIDFPGYSGADSLQEITWDEFFEKFDERNLSLLFQEETAGGQKSNFNKLVSAETAEEANEPSHGRKRSSGRGGGAKKSASARGGNGNARKSAAGGAAKKVAAKKTASKGVTKKAASKSATPKKAVTKSAGRPATKKAAVKKSAAAPARKAGAKKAVAKKATKKAAPKKAAGKSPATKKATGKKATRRGR